MEGLKLHLGVTVLELNSKTVSGSKAANAGKLVGKPDQETVRNKKGKGTHPSVMLSWYLDEERDFRSHVVAEFDENQRQSQQRHKEYLDQILE